MGFFSQGNYGTVNYLENVQADPSYCDNNGIYRSLVEGYENDRIMFEHMLEYDFKESTLVHEGSSEQIELLQENVFTSFFSKLKELFKKIWAKIKAVFHGFIAKFSAKLGSENKAFAKKYRKEIYKKNLTNFEAKYEKPSHIEDFITLSSAKIYSIEVKEKSFDSLKSALEDYDEDEEMGTCLKTLSGCNDVDDAKDFEKTIHEWCFEDKDTIEGPNEVEAALTHLESADKTISNINKASDKIQKAIGNCIKEIDKMDTAYFKNLKWDADTNKYTGADDVYKKISYNIDNTGTDAIKTSRDALSSGLSKQSAATRSVSTNQKQIAQNIMTLLSKKANTARNAFNKVSAACLKEAKFYIAQDRMLVAKAVAYRPKNESTELVSQEEMDFFGDIAAWEVETDLR